MHTTKKLISIGFLLSGALTGPLYQDNLADHLSHKNCNHQQLKQIMDILQDSNPLCAKWDDQKCLQCAAKTYFNEKGICTQIDPLCKNFDDRKKICLQCYSGYKVKNGLCILQKPQQQQNASLSNPLCASWSNKKCTKCSNKSYFNQQNICVMANPDCKTFSETNGFCLSCFDGYQLKDGKCLKRNEESWRLNNVLCSEWNSSGFCVKCSARSFRNKQGICQQIDPNCNSYQLESGQCLTCYHGFTLKNSKCIVQTSSAQQGNQFCSRWNKSVCVKCSDRTYMNKNSICTPVNANCRTYSQNSGQCTSCYKGFMLNLGLCVNDVSLNEKSQANPLCGQWQGQKCVKCSPRSYFNNEQICIMVDPNCNTFNERSGFCLSCYPGFQLQNGKCIAEVDKAFSIKSNPLCGVWENKKCIKCSPRSYFQQNGLCVQIDPNCKDFSSQNRICEKCYSGYRYRKDLKRCLLPGQSSTTTTITTTTKVVQTQKKGYDDIYCSKWQNSQICEICATGTYKNSNGKCILYDINCKSFNQALMVCQECYSDFIPIQQKCYKFSSVENGSNFDIDRCIRWRKGQCVQCANNLYKNQAGACVCV